MRKDKLVEFLIRSGFTFQVGEFIIPAFIFNKDNKTIDLRENRFSTFKERKSTWVRFFELIILPRVILLQGSSTHNRG